MRVVPSRRRAGSGACPAGPAHRPLDPPARRRAGRRPPARLAAGPGRDRGPAPAWALWTLDVRAAGRDGRGAAAARRPGRGLGRAGRPAHRHVLAAGRRARAGGDPGRPCCSPPRRRTSCAAWSRWCGRSPARGPRRASRSRSTWCCRTTRSGWRRCGPASTRAGARYAELAGWDAEEPSAGTAVSARSALSGGAVDEIDLAAGTAVSTVDGVRMLSRAWEEFRGGAGGPVRVYVPVLGRSGGPGRGGGRAVGGRGGGRGVLRGRAGAGRPRARRRPPGRGRRGRHRGLARPCPARAGGRSPAVRGGGARRSGGRRAARRWGRRSGAQRRGARPAALRRTGRPGVHRRGTGRGAR